MAGIPTIDVSDITLFGNEASELEDEEIFFSYAVNRKELGKFLDEKILIQVACSYKGEGKSGLLRLVKRRLAAEPDSPMVISAIGTDLSPPLNSDDSDEWTRAWKERIVRLIASEIGSKIGVAQESQESGSESGSRVGIGVRSESGSRSESQGNRTRESGSGLAITHRAKYQRNCFGEMVMSIKRESTPVP
jgi:hypothetical protein